jgi:methylated-DNA-[protein]-cysteine S-methyltransferase
LRSIQRNRVKEKQPGSSDSFYEIFESPIGTLYLIIAGKVLREIAFSKPSDIPRKDIASHHIKKELREYFKHGKDEFTLKIEPAHGTEFEKKVWGTLREIPFGETRTYKWLAEKIGKPNASRAVGQALGKNPLPIILPCHRIIESDGSIGGYSGGVDIKRRLLDMEYYIKMEKNVHAHE